MPQYACIHASAVRLTSYLGAPITGKIVVSELFLMRISLVLGLLLIQGEVGRCASALPARPRKSASDKDAMAYFICSLPAPFDKPIMFTSIIRRAVEA